MASTPHPPPKPEPPKPSPPPPPKAAAHEGELTPLAEDDPNRVITVGEEQMARSLEMQAMGVDKYMAAHSGGAPEEQHAAAGVVAPPPPTPHHREDNHKGR
jgi:hypothetical protein